MELNAFFKGIVEGNDKEIVICDLSHIIIYMNKAAVKKYGDITGRCLLDCHSPRSQQLINRNVEMMKNDVNVNKIFEVHSIKNGTNCDVYTAAVRDDSGKLIGYYEKFEDKDLYSKETSYEKSIEKREN